jgi:hypothetical protein
LCTKKEDPGSVSSTNKCISILPDGPPSPLILLPQETAILILGCILLCFLNFYLFQICINFKQCVNFCSFLRYESIIVLHINFNDLNFP